MSLLVRSVNILVQGADGRVLLQLRDTWTKTFPLMWSFWGGAMTSEDETPAHCAVRELLEELALDVETADLELAGARHSLTGQAQLFRLIRPIEWGMFCGHEGAGAAYLWKHEIERLDLSKPVAEH